MSESGTQRILSGPLAFEVFRFGAPLAIGMALQTTFNLVDAALIAQLPIEELRPAVGALGICDQLAALGTIVSYGVSTAAATLISQQHGAGDVAGMRKTVWQSLLIVLVLSILFGALGLFSHPLLVHVVGMKGAALDVATRYLRVILGGSFSIFFLLQLTAIQRALGSSKTPVGLLALGNVLNVILAVVFLFGPEQAPSTHGIPGFAFAASIARALGIPRMGMVGAAWATIIARALVLVPNVVVLMRRFAVFPERLGGFDRVEVRRLLTLAWPSSTQFVLRISAMILVQSLVARYYTSESDQTATTSMGLVFRVDSMALFVAMGWGSGAQTFVAQNVGAGQLKRAQRSGFWCAIYDLLTTALLLIGLSIYAERILRFFGGEGPPVALAAHYLRIVGPSYLALGFGVVLGNAMAGAGATRTTLAVDAAVLLLFQLPVSLVLTALLHAQLSALFYAVAFTALVAMIAYCVVYARGKWLPAPA